MLTVAAWACWHAAVVCALLLHFHFKGHRMIKLLPLLLMIAAFVLFAIRYRSHRIKFTKPAEQDVRVLLRGKSLAKNANILLCPDCAGHHHSHMPWCGRERPPYFIDSRQVRSRPKERTRV